MEDQMKLFKAKAEEELNEKDELIKEKDRLIEVLQKKISEDVESINHLKSENVRWMESNYQANILIQNLQMSPYSSEDIDSKGYKKLYEVKKREVLILKVKYDNICKICDNLSKHNIVFKALCDVDSNKLIEEQTHCYSDSEVDGTKHHSIFPKRSQKDQMKRNVRQFQSEEVIANKLRAISNENKSSIKNMVNSWKNLLTVVNLDKRCVQRELKSLANQMQTSAEEINNLLANNPELKNQLSTLNNNFNVLKDSYVDVNSRVLGFVRNKTFVEIGNKLKKCSTRADVEVKNIERYYNLQLASIPTTSSQVELRTCESADPTQKGNISTSKPRLNRPHSAKPKRSQFM